MAFLALNISILWPEFPIFRQDFKRLFMQEEREQKNVERNIIARININIKNKNGKIKNER